MKRHWVEKEKGKENSGICGSWKKLCPAVLIGMALFLTGCDITGDPTHGKELTYMQDVQNEESDRRFKIGVTYADMSNSIWAEEADAIEELAKKKDVDVIIMDCDNDATKQVNQIENFVTMGCDAIIIGATDPGTIDSAAKEAMEAGVVVEAFGTEIEYYTTSLLANNKGAGRMLAQTMAANFQAQGITDPQIAVVNYYGSTDCMERAEAFRTEIGELLPDSEIVIEVSSNTTDENMELAENFLHSWPDLDAVFCIGDSAAVGVLQAIITEGMEDQVSVYSCDGSLNGLSMMAGGAPLVADCSFGSGWIIGQEQLNLALNVLNNKNFVKNNRLANTIITADNLEEMIEKLGYSDQIVLEKN